MNTTINTNPTLVDIIQDWDLWCEYIDSNATMKEEEFDAMSMMQRAEFVTEFLGDDHCREQVDMYKYIFNETFEKVSEIK